jgi:hypothetical protein
MSNGVQVLQRVALPEYVVEGAAAQWLRLYPHNSNPRPANAAALLRHEDAATSAAGALDADSNGSDATAE